MKHITEEKYNEIFVARSRETELVIKQFDRVLEGKLGLTIVTGRV